MLVRGLGVTLGLVALLLVVTFSPGPAVAQDSASNGISSSGAIKEMYQHAMVLVGQAVWTGDHVSAKPGTAAALLDLIRRDPNGPYGTAAHKMLNALIDSKAVFPDWDGKTGLTTSEQGSAQFAPQVLGQASVSSSVPVQHASPPRQIASWRYRAGTFWGAQIAQTDKGDPYLAFPVNCRLGQPEVIYFGTYDGRAAFRVDSRINHGSGASSFGHLVFAHDRVINAVFAGDSYSGHAKAFPDDSFEVGYGSVEIKGNSKGCAGADVRIRLADGKRKDIDESDGDSLLVTKFLEGLSNQFDQIVSDFEVQTGISDPESQLSAAAQFRRITNEELTSSVTEDEQARQKAKAEAKAEEKAEGGSDHSALIAILTGAAEGVSGQGDNPILDAGNQQAAAIRAIGDANAAQQQATAEQRAAAELAAQQAAQQRTAAQQAQQAANQNAPSSVTGTGTSGGNGNSSGSAGSGSSGGNSGTYLAPITQGCVREFWDPKFYNWLSFENDCGQAIHLTFIAKSPSDHFGPGAADLAAGQTTNTGWSQTEVAAKGNFTLFICPAGSIAVDPNTNQAISSPNATYSCKKQ
jgi:hypothetical protein